MAVSRIEKEFGFYPQRLDIDIGAVRICTLSNFEVSANSVSSREEVHDGWIYAWVQQSYELYSREVRVRPYGAREFGLPKTHRLEHSSASDEEQVAFLLWALSFFLGLRLSWTEAGFLDATPIKPGKLVDFVLLRGQSVERANNLVETFWLASRSDPRNTRLFAAAVNALFLGQYPQALQFEKFIYLYTAIDACYKLTKSLRSPAQESSHASRIGWMCNGFGIQTPTWAQATDTGGGTEVSTLRNDALHEVLYADEPLGFSLHGTATGQNLTLEMRALVCRLLVALIGGQDPSYLTSSVNTRQPFGLSLP